MNPNNRRYLGNKYKLLAFIKKVVNEECDNIKSFFDAFAGTGSVSSVFTDKILYINDILYSNHLSHLTWFSNEYIDIKKIKLFIDDYNNISNIEQENYMSTNFSNTYFSYKVCQKIGYIRDDIEYKYNNNFLNKREHAILVTSLLYAIDKIANTCGHYDAYREINSFHNTFSMEVPIFFESLNENNKCFNIDANKLAEYIECDIAYLDPPYNSRQYCDAYHLLENIARWEKKEVFGKAKKMNRDNLKSLYCSSKAAIVFEDIIEKLNCRYILLSYNNTGDKLNHRSNSKISDEDIINILSKKGKVKIFSQNYKGFTTGKKSNNFKNEERLFLCSL